MWPVLRPGDLLFVDVTLNNFASVEVGDILVGRSNSQFVAHRLIRSVPRCITKGDFGLAEDNEFFILGLVSGLERKGKIIWWGKRGQRMKIFFSHLSQMRSFRNPNVIRWFVVCMMYLFNIRYNLKRPHSIPSEFERGEKCC